MLRGEHRDTLTTRRYFSGASSQLSAAQGVLQQRLVSLHFVVSDDFFLPLHCPFALWTRTCFWLLQCPVAGSSKDDLAACHVEPTFDHWL